MRLWWLQLALNFLWSPLFFVDRALAVVLLLLVAALAFIRAAWSVDRVAASLFLPYAAWVAYASVLNAAILVMS